MIKTLYTYLCIASCYAIVNGFSQSPDDYKSTITEMIDRYSNMTQSAYQFAVRHQDLNFTYASGIENHATGAKLTTESKVPYGSVTKAYTVMGIMRLIEAGDIGFNDSISTHVDNILLRSNGTTLSEIWKGDEKL